MSQSSHTSLKTPSWPTLRKKAFRKIKRLAGRLQNLPKPTEMVALTLENGRRAYRHDPLTTIHAFHKAGTRPAGRARHLPDECRFGELDFRFPTEPTHYDAVVLETTNPGFSFQHNHLLDDRNRVVYEPLVRFDELPIQHEYLSVPPRIRGTVAYLSNTVPAHYGHWYQLQLPLLLSYWELFGKETIDYYYIGDCPVPAFIEEMFERMGLRREQIVNHPCRADRSLASMKYREISKDDSTQNGIDMDEHSYRFLRDTLARPDAGAPAGGPFPERIFIERGDVTARRELNLPEIKALLEPQGFTFLRMDGRTVREQADLFRHAKVVAGVHGSGLHTLLYSPPGTIVLEIFPFEYPEASNYALALHGGCPYYYLVGEPQAPAGKKLTFAERNEAHIRVDIGKLERMWRMIEQENGLPPWRALPNPAPQPA